MKIISKERNKAVKIICMVRNKDNKSNDWCETRLLNEIIKEMKR